MLYKIISVLYSIGLEKMSSTGACVTVCVITEKKIYTAQLGDSKAKLFQKNKNGKYNVFKLTTTHNSEKNHQKEIMRKEFKNDPNIIMCRTYDQKFCYVKGRLQPTRSLGDFYLKFQKFNLKNESYYSI